MEMEEEEEEEANLDGWIATLVEDLPCIDAPDGYHVSIATEEACMDPPRDAFHCVGKVFSLL